MCTKLYDRYPTRPKFDELPLRLGDPKASAWGLWGDDDQLGTLNLLTEDLVKGASKQIEFGTCIPLNLPLDGLLKPMNPARRPCEHRIVAKGHANDDEIYVNTQGSSHWDGLRHYPYQETLQYYNGVRQEKISGEGADSQLGIQSMAQRGIAGRGVLLDWCSYAKEKDITYSPFARHEITLAELKEVAAEERVTFQAGDILLIRTGWLTEYKRLTDTEKAALPQRETRASCGVEATEEAMRWHWENAFAAVASDTVAYEVWPSLKPWGVSMHEVFLSGWGMPIGETWDLEELSRVCRQHDRWDFFITSQPLNLLGGVASPPNAMAIL